MDRGNKDVKFVAYVVEKTLEDSNGGSLVLAHHLHALCDMGYKTELINLTEQIPQDTDYVMFQSEWWAHIKLLLEQSNAKRICWLGHYNTSLIYGMPKISEIKADYFHTQYKGEAVSWGKEQIGKPIYYLPHAGCHKCNTEGKFIKGTPKAVIVRNKFKERSEDWLDYANITAINAPFETIKDIYASAIVSPCIHGDFQKGKECEFFQTPAHMINERIFQVILSGGFCISDDTPIVAEFFSKDEVPQCETREEFKEKIEFFISNPDKRIPYMEKAKEKILNNHLYKHRWQKYLLSELGLTGRNIKNS